MNEYLNRAQWNSLRISILSFERRLREAQDWLDGLEEHGTFYHRQLAIPDENRQEARRQIEQALQLLGRLGARLELPFQEETVNSELRSEMTISWANLLDNRASKLGRFGEVHPSLSGELDATIEELAGIANLLAAIFGETNKENP
jgi:hypothetical protein